MSEEKDTTQQDDIKNEEQSTSSEIENIPEATEEKSVKGSSKEKIKKSDNFISPAEVKPGMIIKLWQKIKETNPKGEIKERLQYFEGTVLGRKGGNEPGATITVRKISNGVGVEKIFPLSLPTIEKIELLQKIKIRRAKLYFLREGYKKRLKKEKIA